MIPTPRSGGRWQIGTAQGAERDDRVVLPAKHRTERVDLRLLFGREGGKTSAITLEECPLIRRLPMPVAGLLRLQLGHQRGHLVPDLTLDLLELALGLPACFLHAGEAGVNWDGHDAHPGKLEGPP